MAIETTVLDCGCEIHVYGDRSAPPALLRCPLHAYAAELLAAAAALLEDPGLTRPRTFGALARAVGRCEGKGAPRG